MDTKKTYIIAEIGNNHEGSVSTAKKLIKAAYRSGVDAVKFQTYVTEEYVTKSNPSFKRLKKFELKPREFVELHSYAKKLNLDFISTPLDFSSARLLINLCSQIKVASGDNNFYDLIEYLMNKNKKIIISSGLSTIRDLKNLVRFILKKKGEKYLKNNLILMHCVTSYPVEDEMANLLSVSFMKENFNKYQIMIGYSDHTIGLTAPIAAVALGAQIIEKHFTLDKNFSKFRDHKISLEPDEMKLLVSNLRILEKQLGTYGKNIQKSEKKFTRIVRRNVFAKNKIFKNEKLNKNNLLFLRSELKYHNNLKRNLFNTKSKKNYLPGDLIKI